MSTFDEVKAKIISKFDAKLATLSAKYEEAKRTNNREAMDRYSFAIHEVASMGFMTAAAFYAATKPD